ncbi:hypothetical protein WN944_017079 [Citrus x changshan-huyou]|uniref:Uncharacterized protein n=1 Tax=Citrus x changshan-huyou TaxID=2935761 RepID=A0AAP0MAJ9_9ROSI
MAIWKLSSEICNVAVTFETGKIVFLAFEKLQQLKTFPSLNSFGLCHSSYHNAVRSLGTKQSNIYTLSTSAISTFDNLALHYILCFSLLPSI